MICAKIKVSNKCYGSLQGRECQERLQRSDAWTEKMSQKIHVCFSAFALSKREQSDYLLDVNRLKWQLIQFH